jgi:hypothetical protein
MCLEQLMTGEGAPEPRATTSGRGRGRRVKGRSTPSFPLMEVILSSYWPGEGLAVAYHVSMTGILWRKEAVWGVLGVGSQKSSGDASGHHSTANDGQLLPHQRAPEKIITDTLWPESIFE